MNKRDGHLISDEPPWPAATTVAGAALTPETEDDMAREAEAGFDPADLVLHPMPGGPSSTRPRSPSEAEQKQSAREQ